MFLSRNLVNFEDTKAAFAIFVSGLAELEGGLVCLELDDLTVKYDFIDGLDKYVVYVYSRGVLVSIQDYSSGNAEGDCIILCNGQIHTVARFLFGQEVCYFSKEGDRSKFGAKHAYVEGRAKELFFEMKGLFELWTKKINSGY